MITVLNRFELDRLHFSIKLPYNVYVMFKSVAVPIVCICMNNFYENLFPLKLNLVFEYHLA